MTIATHARSVPAGSEVRQDSSSHDGFRGRPETGIAPALLRVTRLTVRYAAKRHEHDGKATDEHLESRPAVCEASFAVRPGEAVAIVGESGSGKTTLALAVMRLLPPEAQITGSVRIAGQDMALLDGDALRSMRGARISAIYQEPGLALHPTMRAGDQIAEVFRAHHRVSRREALDAAIKMAESLFGGDAARICASYPHELSGGQQQRVVIAQALVCQPGVVIADEPTASLDGETQREILKLLLELKREMNLALLLITHNIALLPQIADRVLVMYSGRIIEQGTIEQVLIAPRHPYTRTLVAFAKGEAAEFANRTAAELLARTQAGDSIPPAGCAFAPRCSDRRFECDRKDPAETIFDEAGIALPPHALKAAAASSAGSHVCTSGSVRCFLYGR